jgi:hypothetical protein
MAEAEILMSTNEFSVTLIYAIKKMRISRKERGQIPMCHLQDLVEHLSSFDMSVDISASAFAIK